MDARAGRRQDGVLMPLELSEADLARAAVACRVAAHCTCERRVAEQYRELARKFNEASQALARGLAHIEVVEREIERYSGQGSE